jgi:23S rRNA (uracil1939-C5)-methyltransferase
MLLTVRPDRLVAGGDALARDDEGRVVFVHGALPGELVTVDVVTAKKDFAKGSVVEILEPSTNRVFPRCAHRRAGCGGCGWMHLDPAVQFDAKVEIVRESLRRIGRVDASLVDTIVVAGRAVEPTAYRTTIRVVGGRDGGLGFREHASDAVVPVDDCLVAHPVLSALLRDLHVAPGVELTLRTSVTTGAVTARWNRRGSGMVEGLPADVHIGDRAFLVERVAGRDLRVSAASFFQSGRQAAELIVDAVDRAAPELASGGHAVDAYGGVGLFAATVMADTEHVTVVESTRSGCFDAGHNLAGRDVTVARSEVGRWMPGDRPVDIVVADPARPGLAKPGAAALARTFPAPIVLVSCDPVSLARDASLLEGHGYRADRVEVLDLYPQTPHVETVTRFTPSA